MALYGGKFDFSVDKSHGELYNEFLEDTAFIERIFIRNE